MAATFPVVCTMPCHAKGNTFIGKMLSLPVFPLLLIGGVRLDHDIEGRKGDSLQLCKSAWQRACVEQYSLLTLLLLHMHKNCTLLIGMPDVPNFFHVALAVAFAKEYLYIPEETFK